MVPAAVEVVVAVGAATLASRLRSESKPHCCSFDPRDWCMNGCRTPFLSELTSRHARTNQAHTTGSDRWIGSTPTCKMMSKAKTSGDPQRPDTFLGCCAHHQPVFRYFFLEYFGTEVKDFRLVSTSSASIGQGADYGGAAQAGCRV